jgi:hypothetical protein
MPTGNRGVKEYNWWPKCWGKKMTEHNHDSPLEHRLHIGALIGALLSIPVVFMQASEDHQLHKWGNVLGITIWLFFVLEVTVLLRIAPDNWAWIKAHKLEFFIVIAASPLLTMTGDREMVFGITPLLIIPRLLHFVKFAKFMKIGKLLKTLKIMRKDKSTPDWVDTAVLLVGALFIIGIVGTLIDEESHSLIHGFKYWLELVDEQFHVNVPYLFVTVAVIGAMTVAITKPNKNIRNRKNVDYSEEANSH